MGILNVAVPSDYDLSRDVCSYGYFLLAPNHWVVESQSLVRVLSLSSAHVAIAISQPRGRGTPLKMRTSQTLSRDERERAVRQVTRMLRLDEGHGTIGAFHALDPRFAPSGRGRLFRSPTLFEDVIKTVTSCNVTWPSTIQMNRRLCEVLGPAVAIGRGAKATRVYGFPSAARLARARPEMLRARCRVGYRDRRIVELAGLFARSVKRGGVDVTMLEDPQTPDGAVFEYLIDLPGIGPYAAANIMQLMGRYSRLPLDTESVRHGRTLLKFKGSAAAVMKRVRRHFEPFGEHAFRSYWFELWSFYESRHGPAWTWQRDTTGTMFTASQLAKQ